MTDTDLITRINTDENWCIELVTEFFAGKYTREEVRHYLYAADPNRPRAGVLKLVDEFQHVDRESNADVRQWYQDTDFYVFDLLPWNGAGQFGAKVTAAANIIQQYGFNTIVDFGGGLGTAIARLHELDPSKTYVYVDLKDGVTFRFAKFLFEKLRIADKIVMMGDEDFFASDYVVDCILATDCFEHIKNLEETFDKLIEHSNVIFHDSTFFSDQYSPQHLQTRGMLWFANVAAQRNFIARDDDRLLWRVMLQYIPVGDKAQLEIKFV
jgi:hypothetical protein